MAYVNPDPMPAPASGHYHLYAPSPDNNGLCSWCGQNEVAHQP